MLAAPQAVELTEVHVGPDPARLVGLRRLAADLVEEASVSRAGAGALSLGVGGLEGGGGALAAGKRGGAEEGRGEGRLVGGGGSRGGYQRGDGRVRGKGTGGAGETTADAGKGGGERKRAGWGRGGGKRQEGSGKRKTGTRKERAEKEGSFKRGLENVHAGLVGGEMECAEGAT